ncbi:MAG: mevalonate kinase [Saprospiraceae bacterium]
MIPSPDTRTFPAKLLLFGEHVLLRGARALAVPVPAFGGHWAFGQNPDKHHKRLLQFAHSESLQSLGMLDTLSFRRELESGLFFQSDIPTGYGLGSSGALCAAVYDRYVVEKTQDLTELKRIFAQMEGFFHGNSSGIDPLTSFVGAPLLIQNKTEVQRVFPRPWSTEIPKVLLLDSCLPRRTGPLVEWFLAQCFDPLFDQKLTNEYLPAHHAVVEAWLSADKDLFWPNLRRISNFQFDHFEPMIPETLKDFWQKNLDNQDFVLKICGAGGGGFLLGFSRNIETEQQVAQAFKVVFPFKCRA